MQISFLRYTKFLSHLKGKKEKKIRKRSEKKLLNIWFMVKIFQSEKTEISLNPTNAVSTFDYDEEIVTAEFVLNSLPSGDMELQESHIPEDENIDETLELLPELLDKSYELNIKTSDGFGRDRQLYTNRRDRQLYTNNFKTAG